MEMTKEKRDKIITTLYERCSKGEISCEQRETLIRKTNSMFVVSESTERPETTVNNTKELSPKEKYNAVKSAVYTKHSNGEITLEQREELLEKARDRFCTISE